MSERVNCPFCGGPGERHECAAVGGRIVAVSQPVKSPIWFMSSVGDLTDWDYSQPDPEPDHTVEKP